MFSDVVDFDPGIGIVNRTAIGMLDIFIAKYDSTGKFIWVKQIGGTKNDGGQYITSDKRCNIYITGSIQDTVDFDPSGSVYKLHTNNISSSSSYIAKYDSTGQLIWANLLRDCYSASNLTGKTLAIDNTGHIYTTGLYFGTIDLDPSTDSLILTSKGYNDSYLSKYDSSGKFIWAKHFSGPSNDNIRGLSLDILGNPYVIGDFEDSVMIDSNTSTQLTSLGKLDYYIASFDVSGNFGSAKQFGSINNDFGIAIDVNSSGGIYSTGTFSNTLDFDPSIDTSNLTVFGDRDIFVHKMSTPSTKLTEVKSNSYNTLYPNPNEGSFNIKLENNPKKVFLHIRNILGQIVYSHQYTFTHLIHISNKFEPGIYYVEIIQDGLKSVSKVQIN